MVQLSFNSNAVFGKGLAKVPFVNESQEKSLNMDFLISWGVPKPVRQMKKKYQERVLTTKKKHKKSLVVRQTPVKQSQSS